MSKARLVAIFSAYNEATYLPSFFENLAPLVDAIVGLDDGSTDGSGELMERAPSITKLLRRPVRDPHEWNESLNRQLLREAAFELGADWILGIDVDERLERGFRERADAAIDRAKSSGVRGYAIRACELWDAPDQYRCDGIWGQKWIGRLFKADPNATYSTAALHGPFGPIDAFRSARGHLNITDIRFYHLRMIHAADREARRQKYNALDPNQQQQAIGYDYLTDESGLVVEKIPPGREYVPLFHTGTS